MTIPKHHTPVRLPCMYPREFCPRNAEEGSEFCDQHQPRIVAASPSPPVVVPSTPPGPSWVVPAGAVASPAAYALTANLLGDDAEFAALDAELDEAERVAGLGRRRFHRPRPEPIAREALLPFELGRGHSRTFMASPQKPFKPRGLMLWDVPHALNVEATIIGNNHQLMVAFGKVPALWFAQAQTFEQVVADRAKGKEPSSWGSWDALYPGIMVRLEFDGDASGVRAVMWGHST